ncbi:transcriptional regulator with XRE-family HTH domain [Paucibacter oligotrophus]|uniref:Transcriptional regulator with XRE-family HTH domain n=1 Tax=Roseateles oligotrophus TaxID=1769250 RepID=A0A840L8U9_9BURK|nr:transcriptional regulator with XRE-family HTH domain [Roseateles oligotrophus]
MINGLLFFERLKEARKERGWSQAEAAEVGGVSREYWGRCERGSSIPGGEVLAALAAADFDVMFVLTGKRRDPCSPNLTAEEQTMLDYFREASKEVRRAALGALLGAASGPGPTVRIGGSNSQHSTGANAVNIGSIGETPPSKRRK